MVRGSWSEVRGSWCVVRGLRFVHAPHAHFTNFAAHQKLGVRRRLSEPSVFVRGEGADQVMVLVYVDDLLLIGDASIVQQIVSSLSQTFIPQTEACCKWFFFILKISDELSREGDSVKMLGHLIKRLKVGYSVTGDFGVVKPSKQELGLSKSQPVSTPSVREVVDPKASVLDAAEHRSFRRHVGRLNYLDRPDLKYSITRLSQALAKPTSQDVVALKRVLR